ELGLAAEGVAEWRCLVGGSKKWKEGAVTMLGAQLEVKAWRVEKTDEFEVIRFEWQGHPFSEVLRLAGKMPLPPYIDRDTTPDDSHRYQTVYARVEGSVAAPTAGLHFSESLLNQLDSTGMLRSSITLHVGAGTFKPMSGDTAGDHRMHEEYFSASRALIEHLAGESRPVIAVGTTSMRALESLYWLGVQVLSGGEPHRLGQWFPYENKSEISVKESLTALSEMMKANDSDSLTASTSIMIVPGYRVRMAKGLVTNFHLPKSTLLMLVAALIGKDWKKVYDHALSNNYRFLSYGDASLLLW
ncbi:MAG: S-adenosylmethionine:tRNA ribosyltransferase-isomerase, partial [Flavobacteriales bacterium]|nr:S-adenosylmethionine:tRNA ribosyltransferase-isomerase [Flavobacteriales bacterium]